MAHVNRDKKKLLSRVRRIQGQLTALETALNGDVDCTGILVQIAAAKGAIHGLMIEVLAGHLAAHVAGETSPRKRSDEAERLIELLRHYSK